MTDELTFDITANDRATSDIKRVQSELGKTGDAGNQAGQSFQGASKQSVGFAANLGKIAKAGAVAGSALFVFQKVGGFIQDANEVANEFAIVSGDMEQAIRNTGASAAEMESILSNVNSTTREFAQIAGTRVPEMNQAFVDLTSRVGDAGLAAENMERVLGLMNLTGKEAGDTAKTLGQALTGNFGALEESGILTREQVKQFTEMEDSGRAVELMLESLDSKIEGFANGLPEASVQSDRIAANFERFQAAMGDVIDTTPGMTLVGDITEKLADQAEDVSKAWREGARSITEDLARVEKAAKGANTEIEKLTSRTTRADLARERVKLFERELETQKMLIQEQVRRGEIDQFTADLMIRNREANLEAQRAELLGAQGIFERRKEQLDFEVDIAEKQLELLRATSVREKARLQVQLDFLKVQDEYNNKMAQAVDEEERIRLEKLKQIELESIQARNAQTLADIREDERSEQKNHTDEMAAAEQRAFEWMLDHMQSAAQERIDLFRSTNEAFVEEMKRGITESERVASEAMERGAFRGSDDEMSLEDEEADVIARGQSRDLSGASDVAGGAAAGFSESRAILESQLEDGEELNETLASQLDLWAGLSEASADFTTHLSDLAEQQWDFASASDASLGALEAITGVGGAMAGALTDNVEDAAAIQSVFEFAAAAGALALGLTWGGPNFFAAAIQHGIAGASYAAIAGGGGGAASSKGGGASAGKGGGSGSMSSINVDAEREKTASAIAAAIEGQNQAQGITINMDLGSNNVIPSDSAAFGRVLVDQLEDATANIVGLGV